MEKWKVLYKYFLSTFFLTLNSETDMNLLGFLSRLRSGIKLKGYVRGRLSFPTSVSI